MTKVDLPCWIDVGTERLAKGLLVAISESGAQVRTGYMALVWRMFSRSIGGPVNVPVSLLAARRFARRFRLVFRRFPLLFQAGWLSALLILGADISGLPFPLLPLGLLRVGLIYSPLGDAARGVIVHENRSSSLR